MCGIAGFVGDFPPEILNKMTGSIAHRGPDGDGHWFGQGVALGHRRLSIIDLSENASQPMESKDGRYITIYNGEIYNFKELSEELKLKGYQFNSDSDTAILAPLYDAYGEKMLDKLSSIFAFAIWDKKEETLFCARDHIGTKPFYYTQNKQGIAFASELKTLLHIPQLDTTLDMQSLADYLTYLWCPGEGTLFKSVKKLLPGHYMKIQNGKVVIHKWYSPPLPTVENNKPIYEQKKPEDLLHLLDEIVGEQMVSDVPVGAFLSGGVDSSAVVASMCQHTSKPIETFCIKNDLKDEGFSEDVVYARMVAERYNVKLNEIESSDEGLQDLPKMVETLDEPQADPAPLYVEHISAIAKKMGIKVLMSGTGGDDVFSGYRRHQAAMLMDKLDGYPPFLKNAVAGGCRLFTNGKGPLARRMGKLSHLLKQEAQEGILNSFAYTDPDTIEGILINKNNIKHNYFNNALKDKNEQHLLNKLLYLEAHGFLPDHNLNYTDKMGMAEGVEIRVPLLDKKLFDFAHNLPVNQKIHGTETKYILKKALETRLPREVLYRSKAGFGAPIRSWIFSENTKDMVQDLLFSSKTTGRGLFDTKEVKKLLENTQKGVIDNAYTILSLMVIELWLRQFFDKIEESKLAA
jgi:asparagine synthase (glutamine-hydrolysing)